MGYNQEISILRSTHNEIENRLLNVEMKIAENPDSADAFKKIIEKQEERKADVDRDTNELEEKIAAVRAQVEEQNEKLQSIDIEIEESAAPPLVPAPTEETTEGEPPRKKAKTEPTKEEEQEADMEVINYQEEEESEKAEV